MKPLVLALCLLVAVAPVALAGSAVAEPAPAEGASTVDCDGPVCEVLCEVNEALGRPCLR